MTGVSGRLLFVITGLDYGGAETQLVHLATLLKRRGWKLKVVTLIPPKAYVEELAQEGIPVATLGMRRRVPDPRAILRLARHIRQWKPDIVHSHMVHANILARVTQLFARVPTLVCTVHSICEGGRVRETLYRFTDPLCEVTTHVCQAGAARYIQVGAVPANKIRHVPNGVDTRIFRPDVKLRDTLRQEWGVSGKFVWLAVGRIDTPKDYPNLLRAFSIIARDRPDSLLWLAGDGPLRTELDALVRDLEVQEQVRLLGIRRDIPQLMNAADAYVMSSAWEGLPMVLLEAHACGLPIVATDVGGDREVVIDGVTGFLVPPRQPEALAQAMEQMMQIEERARRQMGEKGREHIIQNYSLEHVVQRWEELYRELLTRKAPRRGARESSS